MCPELAATEGYVYGFQSPEGLLAHYTSAAVAFEHVLPTGQLRMSPYRRMRDPAENKDLTPGTAYFGDPPNPEQTVGEMIEHVKAVRDSMRLLSFTRDASERGGTRATFDCSWARPRIWEQCGHGHRGACLVFDRAVPVWDSPAAVIRRPPVCLQLGS